MRKHILRGAVLALALAVLPASVLADRFAVVKGGTLNLRQSPNINSYSLGTYGTGSWVLAAHEQNGWYEVTTLNGKHGYMSAAYLNFGETGSSATVKYANGGYVNLRTGPSLDDAVVMRVTSGTAVQILRETSSWYYVSINVGGQTLYGYMHESLINCSVEGATVTTRNGGKVNLRSGPGSKYSSVGTLASGTQVSVLLKGNGWYKISANGLEGYMSTQYLSGTGATVGSNTGGSVTASSTAWVNNPKATQVLNLRETPSQNARALGQYYNGTKVKVVSKGATWCEVYVGTRHGYMMTRYLSFNGQYVQPQYTSAPSYVYPTATPTPLIYCITPTPEQLITYITPTPAPYYGNGSYGNTNNSTDNSYGPTAPKSGDSITLAPAAGSASTMIPVYDQTMTQVRASFPAGTRATMLQYGNSSCMVYVEGTNGGVYYVSTWNVNY